MAKKDWKKQDKQKWNGFVYIIKIEISAETIFKIGTTNRTPIRRMLEIAEEKGIEQTDLQAKMHELARARWAEKGLNESEIAEREAFQEQRQASCDGTGSNHAQGGFGRVNR